MSRLDQKQDLDSAGPITPIQTIRLEQSVKFLDFFYTQYVHKIMFPSQKNIPNLSNTTVKCSQESSLNPVLTRFPQGFDKSAAYAYDTVYVNRISGHNANVKMPSPKTLIHKMLAPTPNPKINKSVAFHTLVFCLWHPDRIPVNSDVYI